MRRHPALIPLSRFHRSVLFTAHMCKQDGPRFKGYPTSAKDKIKYTMSFYRAKLFDHFELEETLVFPALSGHDTKLDIIIGRARVQHDELRDMLRNLEASAEPISALDAFGSLLERHVRMEERELFQRAQSVIPEILETLELE